MFRHIVLFKLHEGTSAQARDAAVEQLRAMGAGAAGVQAWMVTLSLDERKGMVIIQNGLFADEAAFRAFQDSEPHRAAGALMREIADWTVGDYIEL